MLLKSLFEDLTRTGQGKAAVLGWGRGMGHKGHMFLASSVITQSKEANADPYFVVSKTVGKDDPITPEEKLEIYKKVFPQSGHIFHTATDEMPGLIQVLSKLYSMEYTDITVIVGADQVKAMQFVKNYNGKPDKAGNVPYNFNTLNVISRQETNDPSAGEEGPRATPMRDVLKDPAKSKEEKFAVWRDSMNPELSDEEVLDLMKKAAERMGVPIVEDQVSELDVSKTLNFATKAHSKQKYGNKPYITHPRSVASTGKKFFGSAFTPDAIKVALLHDIVEDTPYKLEQLAKMGYKPEVVQAVQLLTKNKNLSYADNIKAIIASGNKLAMMVKYADNYQNFTGDKSDWDADRAAHSQKKYLASLDMLGDVLGVNKHQSTESINESVKPQASIIFDTYNPPDKDSIDGWKVAAKTKFWFVGTDKKRKDSKNPLPYETKLVCMETAWPKVKTHIKNVNNLLELAAEAYKETGEIELFVCTNKESEYKKVLQYNGHKGPHGYYDFERITRRAVPYYRHDKALKTALLDKDKEAFKQATGIDPEKKVVANHVRYEYYDLLEKFLIKRSLSETRLIELEETVRMSAAVKLQRAWDQQQAKSAASRKRGQELLNPPKPQEPKKDEKVSEYGDTAKGQKMLGKVQKRAVDRVVSKKADTDPKYAKKNQDTANAAWDRMKDKDVAEGAPIVVMPRSDRIKKAEPTKVRYQGDIVPPTQPPSTEKRGVKGRPGQRPMPTYDVEESKDKCVPVSESIEDTMASLIRLLENK